MKIYLHLLYFLIFLSISNGFAKLEEEEQNFLQSMESIAPITKKTNTKGDQLEKIQKPMGHKYKKRIFKY